MLDRPLSMDLSQYEGLYDMVAPKEHLLLEINELIDFSFVNDELKDKYCHDNGRKRSSSHQIPPSKNHLYVV